MAAFVIDKPRKPGRGSAAGHHYLRFVRQTRRLKPLRTAVVHPVDALALGGAIEAARAKLIVPVLVGPEAKIRAAARQAKVDLAAYECIWTEHSHAAAAAAGSAPPTRPQR